jgi:hypothetical protein
MLSKLKDVFHLSDDSTILQGRLWIHTGLSVTFTFEWAFLNKVQLCHTFVIFETIEPGVLASVSIPYLVSFYIGARSALFWKIPFYPKYDREIGITITKGIIFIHFWDSTDCRAEFRRNYVAIHPLDILFGERRTQSISSKVVSLVVELPEGNYQAEVTIEEKAAFRPRWPIRDRFISASVKFTPPVPVPGHGETAYSLEDNVIEGMYLGAETENEIKREIQERIRYQRARYGGDDWETNHPNNE